MDVDVEAEEKDKDEDDQEQRSAMKSQTLPLTMQFRRPSAGLTIAVLLSKREGHSVKSPRFIP